jgi:hypothetical protein
MSLLCSEPAFSTIQPYSKMEILDSERSNPLLYSLIKTATYFNAGVMAAP